MKKRDRTSRFPSTWPRPGLARALLLLGVVWIFGIVGLGLGGAEVAAQVRVSGQVVDANTGTPLPSATVAIEGTSRGVVTNRDGQFLLMADRLPFTLEVRFIGYVTRRIDIRELPGQAIEVALMPSTVTLEEIVVSGENPADRIMRRVMEEKARWRKGFTSAYADTYTRFMLYSQLDLVQVTESVRASWWTPEHGARELVRATRTRPQGSGTFRYAEPHVVVNFLDDEVVLRGTTYAGPTHPNALEIYRFLLGGTRELDGQRVFDIYLSPRSATRPAFSGHLAVLDSSFVVLEANLRPLPETVVTPPVQRHDLYFEQRYSAVNDSVWMPLGLYVAGIVEFGRVGAAYLPARYEQFTSQSLRVVNPPVPDSFRVAGPAVFHDPLAFNQDFLFQRNPSMIPLTPKELEDMAAIPPTMTLDQAFRPEGLLAGYTAVPVTREAQAAAQEEDERLTAFRELTRGDWFWYNRVDGWHPGLGWGRTLGFGLQFEGSVGYSTKRKRVTYDAEVLQPWGGRVLGGYIGAEAFDATAVVAREDNLGRFVPGLLTYLGYDDLYDYYHRRGTSVYADVRPFSGPVTLSSRMRWEVHSSLRKRSDYTGWLFTNEQRENPTVEPGHLRSLEFGVSIGEPDERAVEVVVEHSPGQVLKSDYTFTRFEARATMGLRTFYRSRSRPNRLRVTAFGGTRTGLLPIQRQFTLGGSSGPFSEYAGFRTLQNTRFVATELAGIFWYHDFTTAPFEKLGLWWLAEQGLGLHIFGGHAFTTKEAFSNIERGRYHEIGAGVSYPFGLPFRVDVATGTNAAGLSVRIGRPLK